MLNKKTERHRTAVLAGIDNRTLTVGVLGLGSVGLALALAASSGGFRVIGIDINEAKVADVRRGKVARGAASAERVADALKSGRFDVTANLGRLAEVNATMICVPTPLGRTGEPDLSFVTAATRAVAANLRPASLVVLESTTYPGTTGEIVRPIIEETDLRVGEDVFLAYSPDRDDPGNERFPIKRIPKIVGADDSNSVELASAFYRAFLDEIVTVSSSRSAEAVKLAENAFREVNIAHVNELKTVLSRLDIDVFEVIEAATTKPFGYMPFYPGPGTGGSCIPTSAAYLAWCARRAGRPAQLLESALAGNAAMPHLVVGRVGEILRRRDLSLENARLLVVGVAYKRDVDDVRESPALRVIDELQRADATVEFHDPYVPEMPWTNAHPHLAGMTSVPIGNGEAAGYDATLILADHSAIDWRGLVDHASLVIDTRNVAMAFDGGRGKVFRA